MWAEEGGNGNQICEGLITKRDGDGRFGEGQGGRIVIHLDRVRKKGIGGGLQGKDIRRSTSPYF